jgi:pilus assembly protein CpaB
MKMKTWLPIALALVLGLFAAMLAKRGMSSKPLAAKTAKVVIAQRPIAPGETITLAALETRTVPADTMPSGALADAPSLVGRTAQAQIATGKPVVESMLAPQGSPTGLQALVPSGMRAMTIEVNEFSSVGGMITPGARVDILSTMQDPRHSETMSRTIAQNVLVKAVGKDTGVAVSNNGEEAKPVKSVTLIVTSKQAEAIQLASVSGRPWLVLRGGQDNAIASLGGTTLAELRGAAPDMARDIITALRNVRSTRANGAFVMAQQPLSPSTQPAAMQPVAMQSANQSAPRSVHTIRNTVESTVSVAQTAPQQETITGAQIEP